MNPERETRKAELVSRRGKQREEIVTVKFRLSFEKNKLQQKQYSHTVDHIKIIFWIYGTGRYFWRSSCPAWTSTINALFYQQHDNFLLWSQRKISFLQFWKRIHLPTSTNFSFPAPPPHSRFRKIQSHLVLRTQPLIITSLFAAPGWYLLLPCSLRFLLLPLHVSSKYNFTSQDLKVKYSTWTFQEWFCLFYWIKCIFFNIPIKLWMCNLCIWDSHSQVKSECCKK